MTAQANSTESAASVFDSIKLAIALALLAAGVVGFYVYVEYSLLYRTLALVAIAILSCGVFLTSSYGKAFWGFFQQARMELRKVVWPTRQETMHTTLMVVVMVIIVGLLLWMLDSLFLWLVRLLTGQGG